MQPLRTVRAILLATTLPALLACASSRVSPALVEPGEARVATSGGANRSASYVVRVDGGVVVFDLGWWGATGELEEVLADHAPFHMTGGEGRIFFRGAALDVLRQ